MTILSASLALSCCGCRGAAPQGSPALSDSAFLPPGIAAARLPDSGSTGAGLVAEYCSPCHGIPSPASHSAGDWEPTLRRMLGHMERGQHLRGTGMMMRRGMGMGMMHAAIPTEDERRTILSYLQEHGLRAIKVESLPRASAPGAAEFARTCGRCHALPNPAQHPPAEWPGVVARMRGNMNRFKVDTISDDAARQIVEYLQSVAGGLR